MLARADLNGTPDHAYISQQPTSSAASPLAAIVNGSAGVQIGSGFAGVRGVAGINSAQGILDAAWNPNANDHIYALVVSGSTVYVGGDFTSIGGQPRNHVAALDAVTGNATPWNPNADGSVRALAVSGSTVYVSGLFTSIGGQPRSDMAALDASTGNATPWDPGANNAARSLVVSGSTVYAGGYFSSIGGQARNYLAALNASTGNATAWDPNADNQVYVVAVSGSTVYAGGLFSSIGGQARDHVAALDASTGNATAWDPSANGAVRSLVVSGSKVYAGGDFTSIGGQPRNRLATLDVSTAHATSWNPNADNAVRSLVASGSTVYAGGDFGVTGGQSRSYVAALDASTGSTTAWNTSPPNNLVSLLAVSPSRVYAGGLFTSIGGQTRNYLAAFSPSALAVDRPPVCRSVSATTKFNTPVTVALSCSDPDGDATTISVAKPPANGNLGGLQAGNKVTYSPFNGITGRDTFYYRAVAAGVASNTAAVTIDIAARPKAKPTRITSQVTFFISSRTRRFVEFTVAPVPTGGKVEVRCKGKGCPFKRKSVKVRHGEANALTLFKKRLRKGMLIDVYVTAAGRIGEVKRIKVAALTKVTQTLCIPVGRTRPQKTC